MLAPQWQAVSSHFSAIWIADGSTLEHLQRRMGQTSEQLKNPLAGKLMMVEALSHRPVQAFIVLTPTARYDLVGRVKGGVARRRVADSGCRVLWVSRFRGVALALGQPLERISMELVFRSLYHFAQAKKRDAATELIPFFVRFQKSFGLVKAQSKRR